MPGVSIPRSRRPQYSSSSRPLIDVVSWYCAVGLLGLILIGSIRETSSSSGDQGRSLRGNLVTWRPCDEIYVVGEGETLHTISDKCGDPFIVERNPHIHDPDDVFPGLVIKIIASSTHNNLPTSD
ncbi:hypothetical protein IC582_013068 [Cucumis melo]|uniref:Uncharacterized protein LOC103484036 n=2 Tax=Cucumis melo TaxID=3656 RepID=A0A1S3AXP2_CUCME|nr:uncharacterized protein LOC103484036 [Cucumis melo]KAA0063496.1 Peptidoglycan-binding LysM domain-containing protein [Cucumis melo var. makuwa]